MDPVRRREAARRSLFGPVDREQLRRDLELRLREITARDSRRWNFNFQTGTPLPGRFQWEEIPARCAAAQHLERVPPEDAGSRSRAEDDAGLSPREGGAGTDQENRLCGTPAGVGDVRRKRTLPNPAATRGSHARITDFFSKRRRTTDAGSSRVLVPAGSGDAAQCRTMR